MVDPRSGRSEAGAMAPSRASRNGPCPFTSLRRARSIETHSTRSTSGNSRILPEPRGDPISKVLLDEWVTSRSPSRAQTLTRFPPAWRRSPRKTARPPGGFKPNFFFELPIGRGRMDLRRLGTHPSGRTRRHRPSRAQRTDHPDGRSGLLPNSGEKSGTAAGLHWSRPWVSNHPSTGLLRGRGRHTSCRPVQPKLQKDPGDPRINPQPMTAAAGETLARLTSRSGCPGRSHLGGTGVDRSVGSHAFNLNTARSVLPSPRTIPSKRASTSWVERSAGGRHSRGRGTGSG